jgi:hypothetical protein
MTPTVLGSKYVRRGFWLFIFGLVIGYGPWAHYLHGAREEVQPAFLKSVTLWWGCPWTLATYVAQLGGLGMVVVGLCYLVCGRGDSAAVTWGERVALMLCAAGIITEFVFGYAGYFAVDQAWPSFYYTPIAAGKNTWLGMQGVCIALYLAGIILAYRGIERAMHKYIEQSPSSWRE